MSKEMSELADRIDGPLPQLVTNVDKNEKSDSYRLILSSSERHLLSALLRASAVAEPVGYGYSAEIQSAPGQLLHVCRDRVALYDTPLYTHPTPAAPISNLQGKLAGSPAAPVNASVREALDRVNDLISDLEGEHAAMSSRPLDATGWKLEVSVTDLKVLCRAAIAFLPAPAAAPSDIERAFQDACDEAGCAYDNEALLMAIHALKSEAAPTREEPTAEAIREILRAHIFASRHYEIRGLDEAANAILALKAAPAK